MKRPIRLPAKKKPTMFWMRKPGKSIRESDWTACGRISPMKLRLRVSQPGEAPFDFDHTGPVCNMGRDGTCELPFPDKSANVSWRHARIDLGPDGAWVSDLQSSNGTF